MLFKNYDQIVRNGQTPELRRIRTDVLDIFTASLDAVDPYKVVKSRFDGKQIILDKEKIDLTGFKNIFLVGFGKASVGMANAVCDSLNVKKGVIITNDKKHKASSEYVTTFVGGHPTPNQDSLIGTEKVLEIIDGCDEDDLFIVLISGGGSSLLCKPKISLRDLQKTNDMLLKSGANIKEINTVRKHLSFVKGGQLVKNCKCEVVSLIISDIVGDPIEFIASGPTCPDSTTYMDAQKVLEKYNLIEKMPSAVIKLLDEGLQGMISETAKKDNPVFKRVFNFIVANNQIACKAAIEEAEKLGYKTMLLTTSLTGEARDVGRFLVDKALNYYNENFEDIVFVSGGETTVKVKGNGKGGRNQEMVLGGIEVLAGSDMVFACMATDGIDGMSDAAGAIADGYTIDRANKKNLDPKKFLENNNSYEFFRRLGDLLITGSTGTNVMDLHVLVKYNKNK
ncbi:MAG: glycerate kinase [Candidatus Thermoplasmatota archaeon]|jgi:hydroxypyruvate reductase/glycerate 2-kinase|nr:glycerate kinase [Candidatus Thermoplasmatota archaeon]